MGHAKRNKLVFTVKDRCRVCYTCLRECPVKAIKIINGQAEVLSERCIGCGNCVSVCSQNAKEFLNLTNDVLRLLAEGRNVVALLAPSYIAEFSDIEDPRKVVGMIKSLGFSAVMDVAFGADLVARAYKELLDGEGNNTYISSDCPAVVFYVEHFHPDLVDRLAPVASPMVATARLAKQIFGNEIKTVFIGPCVAKKAESDEVDEALTFKELRELFHTCSISADQTAPSCFDGPVSGMGAIFPLSRGLLQTVKKTDNVADGKIIVDSGKTNFKEAIKEYERGEISDYNLELLCCNGCIMGPGMTVRNKHFFKKSQISKYVIRKLQNLDTTHWEQDMKEFRELNLFQTFNIMDRRIPNPGENEILQVLRDMNKTDEKNQLNCGACGYDTCMEHARAVVLGYAEVEMCLPFSIEKLHNSIEQLNLSNEKLMNTRLALKHSEKLANMGQISAGIAHELNNPLGVITMYSNILLDELNENDAARKDLQLIVEQSERCRNIVSGLLNFARRNKVNAREVDMVKFLSKSLESVVLPQNITCSLQTFTDDTMAMVDEEQMMQAITNIEKNAVEAMPGGGHLSVKIDGDDRNIFIEISDTGSGIQEENMSKLFTPFFTTKAPGKGTGLGLPLVYGIIKMHKGKIEVVSNVDPDKGSTGTTFKITIARII
jgi:signal transduction histidine kinase/iron only hydrogenase large subunit-like protein